MCAKTVFDLFAEKSPLPVMARSVMQNILTPKILDSLFQRHAFDQYTREIAFSTLVNLMAAVTCGIQKSVHASYRASEHEVGASAAAVYEKLAGVETQVSEAMVRETAATMAEVIDEMDGGREPLLPGYRIQILDGNCLGATEHRIFELRSIAAGPLPGKSLAVLDPQRMLIVDLFECEDGHAQERSLLDRVLETIESGDLWIADRNFCTAAFLAGIARRQGCFIIRHHKGMVYEECGGWKDVGKTDTGYVMEKSVKIVDDLGQRFMMRLVRVSLSSPTRDGDEDLLLLTNLPAEHADGVKVAQLYRDRWKLETAFQHLTTVLRCEINTLGYPKAALFSFAVAVLCYNIVSTTKAALRAVHGQTKGDDEVSTYHLVNAIVGPYEGMMTALPAETWTHYAGYTAKQMAAHLLELAENVNLRRIRKSPRGPKKPRTPRVAAKDKPHVSTKRLLDARKTRGKSP